jgi:hypothetical protein
MSNEILIRWTRRMPIGTEVQVGSTDPRFASHDEAISTGVVATFNPRNPRPGNSPLGTIIHRLELSVWVITNSAQF